MSSFFFILSIFQKRFYGQGEIQIFHPVVLIGFASLIGQLVVFPRGTAAFFLQIRAQKAVGFPLSQNRVDRPVLNIDALG